MVKIESPSGIRILGLIELRSINGWEQGSVGLGPFQDDLFGIQDSVGLGSLQDFCESGPKWSNFCENFLKINQNSEILPALNENFYRLKRVKMS